MIILRGNKNNIDFLKPTKLTELERERFINFLKNNFDFVEEREVEFFRVDRLGSKNFTREWDEEEYQLLLQIDKDNYEVSRKLGRSWMSIEMKRLDLIPQMMKDAAKKGVDIYEMDVKEFVKNYLKEHKEELLKKKKIREEKKQEDKKRKGWISEKQILEEEIPKFEKLIGTPGFPSKDEIEEKKKRLEKLEKNLK